MKNDKLQVNTLLLSLLAVLLMSFVPVLIKSISANEITIGIVRLAIAAAGIGLIVKIKGQPLALKENAKWLLLLGLVFSGHWFTYFKSLKLSTVSLGAVGICTFGIHLLWLNRIFFKQKITRIDLAAVLLSLIGVILVSPDSKVQPQYFTGFMIAVFSGFLYACLPIINRKATHLTTEQKAFGQFGFGLLFFGGFFPLGNWQLTEFDWLGLAALGIVCTLMGHTLWIKASTELPNSITATVYYLYVPIAMLQSYLVFDEQLTWQKICGASLVIGANILTVLMHRK